MKRLFYAISAVALISSFAALGGRSYAAHSGAARLDVKLCSSAPIGVPGDSHIVRGIFNGVELATSQWRARFRAAGMNLLSPKEEDDAKADGSAVDPNREATNAHTCLDDPAAMAYIGTLNSSMAQVSEPILNKGGMVMISPANSNPILTSPSHRSIYEPLTANGTLKFPTYYRVVTTDNLQGPADARYLATGLHARRIFVADDGQTYGLGLATAMKNYNASAHLGMTIIGTGRINTSSSSAIASSALAVAQQIAAKKPDAVFCGCDEPYSYPLARAERRSGYMGPHMSGDAIYDPSWFKLVGSAQANGTFASFFGPGFSATGTGFRAAYHTMFPHFNPGGYDALSYDASSIALTAIYKAYKAGQLKGTALAKRSAILPYVRRINFYGATGHTTFDNNGDTKKYLLAIFKGINGVWQQISAVRGLPKGVVPTS